MTQKEKPIKHLGAAKEEAKEKRSLIKEYTLLKVYKRQQRFSKMPAEQSMLGRLWKRLEPIMSALLPWLGVVPSFSLVCKGTGYVEPLNQVRN